MENYEKKYKEALGKCIELFNFNNLSYSHTEIEERLKKIFPELAESEDEKIMKELINYLTEIANNICAEENIKHEEKIFGGKCRKWITWLKKAEACDWSEEDEEMYSRICRSYTSYEGRILNAKDLSEDNRNNILNDLCKQELWLRDRLKSIKYRVQPQLKQEWNDEDRIMLSRLEFMFTEISKGSNSFYGNKVQPIIDWLKSLKNRCIPQPQWKDGYKKAVENACHWLIKNKEKEFTVGDFGKFRDAMEKELKVVLEMMKL